MVPSPIGSPGEWLVVGQGFPDPIRGLGTWEFKGSTIRQVDSTQFFAKVLSPVVQNGQRLRYSFTARSQGSGWVGLGLHILVGQAGTHRGFGEGQSWLVWLTRDPVHFSTNTTRLQIYQSTSDLSLTLVAEAPVSASIFDPNLFVVEMDSVANALAITLNGVQVLRYEVPLGLGKGNLVALRSIDKAEFTNFLVEAEK